jgi:hypothetical protein
MHVRRVRISHGLSNYIDKAKCRPLKKLPCKRTLRQMFICLTEAQNPIPHPSHYTQYTCIQYTYSHRGGELNQREGLRGNNSPSWVQNTNMTDCIFSL